MDKNRTASATPHHDPADEDRPGAVLTTQESRQGETSGHMRYVLAGKPCSRDHRGHGALFEFFLRSHPDARSARS